jgi:hypothetical protein
MYICFCVSVRVKRKERAQRTRFCQYESETHFVEEATTTSNFVLHARFKCHTHARSFSFSFSERESYLTRPTF